MRLNAGEPVWHTSVSVWSSAPENGGHRLNHPAIAERAAVKSLHGVGNDREWWIWNDENRVGHLRVGVSTTELTDLPCGVAVHDAGPAGPERPRT